MEHFPVLLAEALDGLNIHQNGFYIDCTFGRGGHSQGILQKLGPGGRLLAIDRDQDAIDSLVAMQMLQDSRFELRHGSFSQLKTLLPAGWEQRGVDGILMDLGVSSPQLDKTERGFSFLRDGPLDMRMDRQSGLSAAEWLQQVDEKELSRVLFEYGEERFAKRIAKAIVTAREVAPIMTTRQLTELIEKAVPVKEKYKHPATRSFQAIRIEINQELEEIKQVLAQSVELLRPAGRLVVISFHSLEDRLVKHFIRQESGRKNNPGRLPVMEKDIQQGMLKKIAKAIRATREEVDKNPRSRSAVMRIAEKL